MKPETTQEANQTGCDSKIYFQQVRLTRQVTEAAGKEKTRMENKTETKSKADSACTFTHRRVMNRPELQVARDIHFLHTQSPEMTGQTIEPIGSDTM